MSVVQAVFWLFSALLVIASLSAILSRQTVHAVLSLILAFFATTVIWILMQAEFLGLVLLFVYVGAVMTLFLFVVMMLNVKNPKKRRLVYYAPLGVLVAAVIVGLMLWVTTGEQGVAQAEVSQSMAAQNTRLLGNVLYTHYAYVFELTGMLLLTAIMAAVALVHRPARRAKYQNIPEQIAVDPKSRIRLVSMKPESR